jgi:hypothetical protein
VKEVRIGDRHAPSSQGESEAGRKFHTVGSERAARVPITEDRGRGLVRLCDATVFKRCAIIAALNEAGWSLAVAGQIALALFPLPTVRNLRPASDSP